MQNDIDIFRGIKSEIQKNPENFKPAGQWLDGYCQNVIKKAKQHRKNLPQIISEKQKEAKRIKGLHGKTRKEISKLKDKSEINEQEKEKLSGLVAKANQLFLKVYDLKRELEHLKGKSQDEPGFIQLMSKAFTKAACEYPPNSRKIMLIAWLLTDKYLSESKLGITKYEQYVFHHEVREPEGNGPQRLVSEQEMAKDAVLARPLAMEKIRDAYLSYQGLFPGESIGTAVQQTPAELNGGNNALKTKPKLENKSVKEPSKEAAQAYKLYYGSGESQTEVAKIMTGKLKKPISQGQVSKWVNQYIEWAKANNISIPEKPTIINMDSNKLSMGARTDGRGTGDPRHSYRRPRW